jgi:AAA ATPase-like protein
VRGSVSDRLAAAVAAALVGRAEERARLTALLAPHGPAAVFVHGPGGIGKTTLVTGTLAALAVNCVSLDGRYTEPMVPGALALGTALGGPPPQSATAAAEQIAAADVDVLVIDSFERLNLLDRWIRNEFTRAVPAGVTTLLVGRRGPNAAWRATHMRRRGCCSTRPSRLAARITTRSLPSPGGSVGRSRLGSPNGGGGRGGTPSP